MCRKPTLSQKPASASCLFASTPRVAVTCLDFAAPLSMCNPHRMIPCRRHTPVTFHAGRRACVTFSAGTAYLQRHAVPSKRNVSVPAASNVGKVPGARQCCVMERRLPQHTHAAWGYHVAACQDSEKCGLASSIGADQKAPLSRKELQTGVLDDGLTSWRWTAIYTPIGHASGEVCCSADGGPA